ncbi:MAG: WecB/TagA/CpsF family glycosyltransferase, partial [Melioribacteraceae bacterium]|nr:WecB/TagA/CpsF family glycosyltransferase [Melioribacteraceae bacterium]
MKKIKILNVNISVIESYQGVYKHIKLIISSRCYITVNNVHTVVVGSRSKIYKEAINNSALSLPDGKPLSIIAKLKGDKNINRIFGPTFMEKTLEWGQSDGLKHYFFGGSESTLKEMLNKIEQKSPEAIIAGYYSPPYREKFSESENNKFIEQMNNSNANIFWIGLGAPKQEIWMYENYKKLNRGVMIGIGAGFDYLAGKTKHAPEWMKNASLEWLYRLIQEP